MGAGAGVGRVAAEFRKLEKTAGDTGVALDKLKDDVKETLTAVTTLTTAVGGLTTATMAMEKSMTQAIDGFATDMHTILDIEKALADGYQQRPEYQGNASANSAQAQRDTEAGFENLIRKLKQAGGNDSALGGLAENILKELKGKIITPEEAIRVLQDLFRSYEAGILRDIGGASTMALRNLAAALEMFIHGGNLNGFK